MIGCAFGLAGLPRRSRAKAGASPEPHPRHSYHAAIGASEAKASRARLSREIAPAFSSAIARSNTAYDRRARTFHKEAMACRLAALAAWVSL